MTQRRSDSGRAHDDPPPTTLAAIGAGLGALSVAAGAFGAHALKDALTELQRGWWQTGSAYLLVHAVVIVAFAQAPAARTGLGRAALSLWIMGACVFASTLLGMALGGPKILGAITPIGGVGLIAGWITAGVAFLARARAAGDG